MDSQRTREILRKVRQVEVRSRRLVDDNMAGRYQAVFKGRGMNFDEVREYVAGDDIRTIDWKVTARTGIPHIKKFSEERELTIILMIDISASGDFGSGNLAKRELMAELGSVLAFSALRNGDKVGLVLFSTTVELFIPAKKGRSHVLRLIREILFFVPAGRQTSLEAPLEFTSRVIKRRCVAFLISDFNLPGDFYTGLSALSPKLQISNRRHDLIAVQVSDPRELAMPDVGLITLEDSETGEQIDLNTGDPVLRGAYRDGAKARQKALHRTIRTAGVDLLDLSTDRAYLPALFAFFQNRQGRR
jgi:uncharacterized protein (DUF58 family)